MTSSSDPSNAPEKEPVTGACPQCLHSVSREPWHRLGFVKLGRAAL